MRASRLISALIGGRRAVGLNGSPAVGWQPKANAGKKKVVLELGGNAACIVDQDADLDDAVSAEHAFTGQPSR